tara:strand:- start:62 stop:580 length:519 start_codon:yes stop_codon:yes gene_type:complete
VNSWKEKKESWLTETSVDESISRWAIESISASEPTIKELDDIFLDKTTGDEKTAKLDNTLKKIRRSIKAEISTKENELDCISLNAPNSSKVQLSVPSNLNYLMKAWAAAEGRDLSSVALQCLETGLRAIKSKGSIPLAAVKRYDLACEKRIALSEVNNAWEEYEELSYQNII